MATGKVTGEEEVWSHTDLWDFQANVDGARIAFENLRRSWSRSEPSWPRSLRPSSRRCKRSSKKYAKGDGFVYYNELTPDQVQKLAALVDSLGEPLSKLTAAVVLELAAPSGQQIRRKYRAGGRPRAGRRRRGAGQPPASRRRLPRP